MPEFNEPYEEVLLRVLVQKIHDLRSDVTVNKYDELKWDALIDSDAYVEAKRHLEMAHGIDFKKKG